MKTPAAVRRVKMVRGGGRFSLLMTLLFLVIASVGFSSTWMLPVWRGTFAGPWLFHLHGGLFLAWLFLLMLQVQLVRARQLSLHRMFGWAGATLAVAMVVSGVAVGWVATRRDLAAGGGDFVLGQFVNVLIEMLIFGGFVALAIGYRRRPDVHQRLLFLATLSMLGPAWLRIRHLFPNVENPFVVFSLMADAVLLLPVAYDLRVLGRIHPTYIYGGTVMVAIHLVELFASESPLWLWVARTLLGSTGVGIDAG
jgi:hypothetical protein